MFHNISENTPETYIGKPDDKAFTLQPLVLFFRLECLLNLKQGFERNKNFFVNLSVSLESNKCRINV